MRVPQVAFYLFLFPCLCSQAQIPEESSLSELLTNLPAVARANHLDLPLYGAKIDDAYKKNPGSLQAAVPLIAKNLANKEPWVQFESVVLVQGLAIDSNDPKFVLQFADQLSQLMLSGDLYTRVATINASSLLASSAPANIIQSLLTTLEDKSSPGRLLTGAVGVLLVTRPTDSHVIEAVLSAVNDPFRPKDLRCQLLYSTGSAEGLVGQPVVDNIISVATTTHDVDLRDAAIGAAERVGLRALNPLVSKLSSIESDPSESQSSRDAAKHALKVQSHIIR